MIYAVTAAALAALVAGFFVDTSNAPLLISIALSAVVMLMILFGWSRKIRSSMDEILGDVRPPEPVEDLAIDVVAPEELKPKRRKPVITGAETPADVTAVIKRPKVAARKPTPAKPPPRKATPPSTVVPRPSAPVRPVPVKVPAPKPAAKKPRPRKPVPPPMRAKPKAKPKGKPKAKAKRNVSTKRVVVIPGRERYHRRSCRFADNDEAREVRETTARDRGYAPCTVCEP